MIYIRLIDLIVIFYTSLHTFKDINYASQSM